MNALRSIGGRTALAAALAATLAFAIAGVAVLLAAGRTDRNALDRDLRASIERVERRSGPFGGPPGLPPGFAPGPDDGRGPPLDPGVDRFARIIGPTGVVLRADGATVPDDFPATTPDGRLRTVSAGGERWRTATVTLGPAGRTLQVGARLAPLESRQRRLRTIVLVALIAAMTGGAALALGLSRVALAPLARLREGAARVRGTDDLSARIEAGGGVTETDELAEEINAMLARLQDASAEREQALAAARRFAADAGHELRTPLTSLTASIATLGRAEPEATAAALKRAEGDLARLSGLVAQLQALARGGAGLSDTAGDVDLGELADAALDAARMRHPAVAMTLEAPADGPVVRGDADGLRGILDNLLENAALHGRRDGRVTVALRAVDGGGADLVVDDDGPGVPPGEREAVLRRFARGSDASAPGTGLGLAIVAAQAARHGGGVTLGDAPLGGLRVTVTLRPPRP